MAPFSLKQKVAHVSPLPPMAAASTKPIARVKPNLHLSPTDAQNRTTAVTPSTPHVYGASMWTVTPRNEGSEDEGNNRGHDHQKDERTHSPMHARERGNEDYHSKHRHQKKHHKKSHHRHSSEHAYSERRKESTHKWRDTSSKDERRRRGHHTYYSDSTNDVSAAPSSDSDDYGRGYREKRPSHSGSGRRRHSSHKQHHRHSRHWSPASHWSSEEKRKERKRQSSEFRRHEVERSVSPDERRHKKVKSDHYMAAGGKESRKLDSGTSGSIFRNGS